MPKTIRKHLDIKFINKNGENKRCFIYLINTQRYSKSVKFKEI